MESYPHNLNPPATLTVRIPRDLAEDLDQHTLFLAESSRAAWTMLPTRSEEQNSEAIMVTEITRTGTYALMALAPEPTPEPTPTPEPMLGLPLLLPVIAVLIVSLISLYSRHSDKRRFP